MFPLGMHHHATYLPDHGMARLSGMLGGTSPKSIIPERWMGGSRTTIGLQFSQKDRADGITTPRALSCLQLRQCDFLLLLFRREIFPGRRLWLPEPGVSLFLFALSVVPGPACWDDWLSSSLTWTPTPGIYCNSF